MKMVFSVLPLSSTSAATRSASARVKPVSMTRASVLPLTTTALTWKLPGPALWTLTVSGAAGAWASAASAPTTASAGSSRRESWRIKRVGDMAAPSGC
jgi:hypothetical protein